MSKQVFFIVGPTGSGKSELALQLARRLGCEIISADSMQVYRGMDIGTAKPGLKDRRGVPHHLIDLVSPRKTFSVHTYRRLALQAVQRILKKGKIPLAVGGSGLYVDALWKGLSERPGENSRLRKTLEREADQKGISFLYERLRKIDPLRARKIHPNDRRRIIRALEIARLSRKRPSEMKSREGGLEAQGYEVKVFGLQRDRADLYERINRRVEVMFGKGFASEVKRLKKSGFSKTAAQALGYKEILRHFVQHRERSRHPSAPAGPQDDGCRGYLIALIQKNTRRFAKRQLTWFRREKSIRWIDWKRGEPVRKVCDKILREIHGSG